MAFVYKWIVPLWADQLLPQLLMEQFDTLSIQYRHIEYMHEHGLQSRPPSPKRAERKVRRRPFREAGSGQNNGTR